MTSDMTREKPRLLSKRVPIVLLLLLFCAVSGCARKRTAVSNLPSPADPPESVHRRAIRPDIPAVTRRDVAILFSSAPSYVDVVTELRKLLPVQTYRLTLVDVEAENLPRMLDSLRRPGVFVFAIGLPAARIARDQLKAPIIFAQVFNYQELLVDGRTVRGVMTMPPLDLQVQDWKRLDPRIQRLGLIVSPAHTNLIPQAERAANAVAITLKYQISNSDRETFYLFKRLVPQIDGLWLVPDDRILSPTVLRELLSYAASHGVRVCVFSDALLQWGAFLSATPTPVDIARTLRRILQTITTEGTNGLPTLTPLSEVLVRVNMQTAGRFGLTLSQRDSWVVRGEE